MSNEIKFSPNAAEFNLNKKGICISFVEFALDKNNKIDKSSCLNKSDLSFDIESFLSVSESFVKVAALLSREENEGVE